MLRPRPAQAGPALAHADLAHLMELQREARGFTLQPRHKPRTLLAGRHASLLRGRGLSFEELRRYQEGDDVRLIDWLATARSRSPHVRVYSEERDRAVLLIVDQRRSMFFGSQRRMKSVAAAELASLAAWRVIASGDRIGAIVFNDEEIAAIHPGRGAATVERVLDVIARQNMALQAEGGAANGPMLDLALRRAAEMVQHDALVLLISDAEGSGDETRRLVTAMARHNNVVAALVCDPLEESLPALGRVVLAEGDDRLSVNLAKHALRQAHQTAFAERRAAIAAFGRERAIPVLLLRTDRDIVEQVRAALAPSRAW